jgi:HEAT repeat protein
MHSASSFAATLSAEAALLAAGLAIAMALGFIFARRLLRSRYFRLRDVRVQYIRRNWEKIVDGEIVPESWFCTPMDRQIVAEIALDRMEVAGVEEAQRLQGLFRVSGLLDHQVYEARHARGWARRKALLTLGRMRVVEGAAALIESLDDARPEVVIDSVRALGRIGTPRAGAAILDRLSRQDLSIPPHTLESALISCCQGHAASLIPVVQEAGDALRPLLARVLAAVVTPDISSDDLLALAVDSLADVRGSAARILAVARPSGRTAALMELAQDKEWFVRLRAVVTLGELHDPSAMPALIQGLCDANRFVRLRAASALAGLDGTEAIVLQCAAQTTDRYALQALISEMGRSGKIRRLADALAGKAPQPLVESALATAVNGGAVRLMAELMLQHPSPRVRERLAQIFSRANNPSVLPQLEQILANSSGSGSAALERLIFALKQEEARPAVPEMAMRT